MIPLRIINNLCSTPREEAFGSVWLDIDNVLPIQSLMKIFPAVAIQSPRSRTGTTTIVVVDHMRYSIISRKWAWTMFERVRLYNESNIHIILFKEPRRGLYSTSLKLIVGVFRYEQLTKRPMLEVVLEFEFTGMVKIDTTITRAGLDRGTVMVSVATGAVAFIKVGVDSSTVRVLESRT